MAVPRIPGPRSRALATRLRRVESRNVTYLTNDFPVFWDRARGARITDVDGNRYLDLTAAFGVAGLGHGASAVQRALTAQARKLWHGMGDVHPSAVKVKLLESLASLIPGFTKAILSSSGAEAVESALKTARLATGKPGVIVFDGAYHGLTYGALATTSRQDFWSPFRDQLGTFVRRVLFPTSDAPKADDLSCDAVETVLKEGKTGAILLEPIQARGGIRIPPRSFLTRLRALADRYDALLIVDEIYTGLGRTGTLFAFQHSGIRPDLVCIGKALANGYPISACLGTTRVMDAWPVSDGEAIHTSTFLGSPLGCAMAVAALKELTRPSFHGKVASKGRAWLSQLRTALSNHPQVGDIRGVGLMVGIELVKNHVSHEPDGVFAGSVVARGLREGLILLSGGEARNVLCLTPPLTISKTELQQATKRLLKCLTA